MEEIRENEFNVVSNVVEKETSKICGDTLLLEDQHVKFNEQSKSIKDHNNDNSDKSLVVESEVLHCPIRDSTNSPETSKQLEHNEGPSGMLEIILAQFGKLEAKLNQTMELQITNLNKTLDQNQKLINRKLEESLFRHKTEIVKELDKRFEEHNEKLSNLDNRLKSHEKMCHEKCSNLETKINKMGDKIDIVKVDNEKKLEVLGTKLNDMKDAFIKDIDEQNEIIESVVHNLEEKVSQTVDRKINESNNINTFFDIINNQFVSPEHNNKTKYQFSNFKVNDPIRFLKDLTKIINKYNDWEKIHEIIGNSLDGEAKSWFITVEGKINNKEEFEDKFQERFCGTDYKKYLMMVTRGTYFHFKHMSPDEYLSEFTTRILSIKLLEEDVVCESFQTHFGNQIANLCIYRKVNSIEELYSVLNYFTKKEILDDLRNNYHNSRHYSTNQDDQVSHNYKSKYKQEMNHNTNINAPNKNQYGQQNVPYRGQTYQNHKQNYNQDRSSSVRNTQVVTADVHREEQQNKQFQGNRNFKKFRKKRTQIS